MFNVEKSNNIGMLICSAYAFGCEELLVVGRPKIVVTGAQGTQAFMKRRIFPTLRAAVEDCHANGFAVCGLEVGGTRLDQAPFEQDTAFLLGNEGRGMGNTAELCDRLLCIPQWGGVPSLNVAVAGSIAMYEFQRRQDVAPARVEGDRYVDDVFVPNVKAAGWDMHRDPE